MKQIPPTPPASTVPLHCGTSAVGLLPQPSARLSPAYTTHIHPALPPTLRYPLPTMSHPFTAPRTKIQQRGYRTLFNYVTSQKKVRPHR